MNSSLIPENNQYNEDIHEMIVSSKKGTHFHIIFNVQNGQLIVEEHQGEFHDMPKPPPIDIKFVEEPEPAPPVLSPKDLLMKQIIDGNDVILYMETQDHFNEQEREYIKNKLTI